MTDRHLHFAGYTFVANNRGTTVLRPTATRRDGDYGCDPMGDGTYRMVPSGDIVDEAERARRLSSI